MTTGPNYFPSTCWSVVLAAGDGMGAAAETALQELCRAYWYPLYAYVRRRGYSPEDAQDLTQEFFHRLLQRDLLAELRPTGARFRSFVLHAMKNLLADEWMRANALKRGGAQTIVSLDALEAETTFAHEVNEAETPEAAFERRWAHALLQRALDRLREEHQAAGKGASFELLSNCLTGAAPAQPYSQLAVQLKTTEPAIKMTIYRMRKRYGELLRLEVSQTVSTPGEIDQELRHLLRAFERK